jgi:hypothetical protein
MTTEHQQELLTMYHQFFPSDRKIYTGKETLYDYMEEILKQKEIVIPIQFGFECGDGWYMLLSELLYEIKSHITNVNNNRKNEFQYKWMRKLYWWLRISNFRYSRPLADWLYEKAPRKKFVPLTLQITQIKEKFGGLRFYYDGGDDRIQGMVDLAETLSYQICERCGSTKNVQQTTGWITTLCEDCFPKPK